MRRFNTTGITVCEALASLRYRHGEEYNHKGEIQLSEYLDHFGLSEGYMLSFCFNKNKETGLQRKEFGDKVLWEVVV